jgi:hypothetical protein
MRTMAVWFAVAWATAACAQTQDPLMVLAATRSGSVEVFDATSLELVGQIPGFSALESVSVSPNGRRLYVAQESRIGLNPCCGLYAVDLRSRTMCPIAAPALFGAPSADGSVLFTQMSSEGIDVFDAHTLHRLSTMKTASVYSLFPAPHLAWLLGITNWPRPALDVFDAAGGTLARHIPIHSSGPATGAWAGDRFYVFSYGPQGGRLWPMRLDRLDLDSAIPVALPDLHGSCQEPMPLMLAGAPGRLFLAEAFGFKVDRRRLCASSDGTAAGGIFMIQLSASSMEAETSRLPWADIHVNRMIATPDGHELYVLDSRGADAHGGVHLLRLNVENGRVLMRRQLDADVVNLTLARIPAALIPRGNAHVAPCRHLQ